MDTRIKLIAIISIILLISGAAVAQQQANGAAGGPDTGKEKKSEKKQDNDSKNEAFQEPQPQETKDTGKPAKPDDKAKKGSNADQENGEDKENRENNVPQKDNVNGKGETAKEKVKQKIKEKIEEHVQGKGEEQSNKVRGNVKEKLEEKIHHARNASEKAKQQYAEAKQKYTKTKQEGKPHLGHAQVMMQAGTGYMEAWLERIELQVLDASNMDDNRRLAILDKIEEYRNETREKKEMINNTTSIQELRGLGKGLNNYWDEVEVFIKSVGYQIAAAKLDNLVGNARGVEVRMAEKIAEMDAADADTSKLKKLLNEYQEKVNAAKESIQKAQGILFNATTIEELIDGRNLVKEATNQIKQAFKDIQLMATEYQKNLKFFGNETGEVFATGDGTANVSVSGIVVAKGYGSINVTEGSLTSATDFGDKITGNSSQMSGKGVYVVRGDNVSVNLSGEDIYLFTKGQGSVNLAGNWSYKIKELPDSEMVFNETTSETLTFGGLI